MKFSTYVATQEKAYHETIEGLLYEIDELQEKCEELIKELIKVGGVEVCDGKELTKVKRHVGFDVGGKR